MPRQPDSRPAGVNDARTFAADDAICGASQRVPQRDRRKPCTKKHGGVSFSLQLPRAARKKKFRRMSQKLTRRVCLELRTREFEAVFSWRSSNFGTRPNNVDDQWKGEFYIQFASNGNIRSKQTSPVAPVSLPFWGNIKRRPRRAKHHTLTRPTKFFLLR